MSHQEIFFHVGLGKVASTYLQHRFFPKLRGLRYIPTNRYRRSKQILEKEGAGVFLVSREFDRQFEREVTWFTSTYPRARIIVLFRSQSSGIASQYRRYVKNGFHWDFEKFLDLKHDQGKWKKNDLLYYPKLEIIERCSSQKPLVLFYDDLKADPWVFLQRIADYTGTTFDPNHISLESVHRSYTEKQLKVLRGFCRRYKRTPPQAYHNKIIHWLRYRPWWAFFHLIMYMAILIPDRWVPADPLISPEQLDEIDQLYQEDWSAVQDYAAHLNRS